MGIHRWHVALGCVTALAAGVVPPPAWADGQVVLGGGAGIVVDGSYCTLTTIGHDKTGQLVGFTAGHCGGPPAPVVAEDAETRGTVGTVVTANGDLDYSVIRFDPSKVTPTANFAGFAINGIGRDPEWHQPECKLGAATGDFCSGNSSLPGPGTRMAMPGHFQPGDDGGPVTSDNLLIAMIHDGTYVPPPSLVAGIPAGPSREFTNLRKFSAILNDVNANGGPGAGFSPVPA